ncbi:DUF2917 domain-containing protein [Niveibacterium sp. SC-1]|uniref:DUF2917 domain-containing protein n=1 Tax=Niveibacterium sp. SC-1 TaxID=3135646 RepID=UPI00311D3E78
MNMRADLTNVVLELEPGSLLSLDAARGWAVRCESGQLWITEAGGTVDILLDAGRSHALRGAGKVLVEGRGHTRLRLLATAGGAQVLQRSLTYYGESF